VLHKDRNFEASATGGADANAYVYNSGLNYFSFRLEGDGNFGGWVQRLAKGAQLQWFERFRYTPESPGFLQGGKAGADDPFLRGIQGFRANTFSNTTLVRGAYPLYRGLSLDGSYRFAVYKVGSILAATSTGASFFNTTYNTWSAGPKLQLTPIESIALLFQQSFIHQQNSAGGSPPVHTDTETILASYERLTVNWRLNVTGGATLVQLGNQTFPTGSIRVSNTPGPLTTVQIDLSRDATPSIYFASGAMISNVGQLQITHKLTRRLNAFGSANYGFSEVIPTTSNVKFWNFTLSTGLAYDLTRSMNLNLFYTHNDFKTDTPGLAYALLRNVVGFGLTLEWK